MSSRPRPPPGGRITVDVADDGVGVPPDKLPDIFDRFTASVG